jgi:hypothetical protein
MRRRQRLDLGLFRVELSRFAVADVLISKGYIGEEYSQA